jgi:hypothetical protein
MDYEALRRKAGEIIEASRATLVSHEQRLDEQVYAGLTRIFKYDAEGLLGHLATLEQFGFPLGSNFEADENYDSDSETYRVVTGGIRRHLEKLQKWRTGEKPNLARALRASDVAQQKT